MTVFPSRAAERERMVREQVLARGVSDERVLAAMRAVPREAFVEAEFVRFAYEDSPLSIGAGQTISQPYMVAFMLEALELSGDERVLEIGTGSGYAAAVLSRLVREVVTIERIPALADRASERLARLGYDNVAVHCGDGTLGWPEGAPFDAIVVTAAAKGLVPEAYREQLAFGGRLVIPVEVAPGRQVLWRETRIQDGFMREDLCPVRFVPLIRGEAEA